MVEEINENDRGSEEEMEEVDVTEISLDKEEINELIDKLQELKQTKQSISFNIDEDNEFLIHYESDESEGGEDGEE